MRIFGEMRGPVQRLEELALKNAEESDVLSIQQAAMRLWLMISAAEAGDAEFSWERAYRRGDTSQDMHERLFVEELKDLDFRTWNKPSEPIGKPE